ncbi:MAG TPA: hypothetical protein VKK31_21880 [Thermoanaerobaculia bacterium]|nr:hypothetical protein [Thermoanaerobaculia bacterium]
MSRTVNLVLASVTAFFLLFPLTLGKPGLPPHLKADEAAYYLSALSLVHDRDLRVEAKDVDRAFQEFPFGPVNNMIVMTDDGWRTVYFGKPYIYSLFAAPFAWLFGANGLLFFNMLLTMAMLWMGYLYLRRYNPPGIAALFSAAFFLLSVGFSYVFWIQPEVFSMAAVTACLFFGLPRADETGAPDRRRELLWAALSGAALVLAVYNKPMFGAVGLAPLWAYARQRRWPALGAWVLGAALSLAAVAGLATALTGHPSAYLGVRRQGVTLCEPGKMPIAPEAVKETGGVAAGHSPTGNAWTWLVRPPDVTLYEMAENIGYFLVGRHTGMLVYTPFAGLAVLFFLLWGRRSSERWVLLAAVSAVALFFLVSIAWNWQGGGGFVGNRYFISVIPAFLFLVTEIRPRWLVLPGFVVAGLFLGPLLFTPFGAQVPEPTLQAHVRNGPFRLLPFELSLRNVPGYERIPVGDWRIVGRKDVFLPRGDQMWVGGANRTELYFIGSQPIGKTVFQVANLAPGNRVEIEMGDAREVMDFGGEETRRIRLDPGQPFRVRRQKAGTSYVYKMVVTTRTGRVQPWVREYPPNSCPYFVQDDKTHESFFVGASLAYLGTGEQLEKDVYGIQWGSSVAPARAVAGQAFQVLTRVFNRSGQTWMADGAARVNLSYHWLDESGKVVVRDGLRTQIPLPVPPGGRVSVEQKVVAPEVPGRYVLELDPVFETVAWFSEKNGGKTLRLPVEVLPAGATPQEETGVR